MTIESRGASKPIRVLVGVRHDAHRRALASHLSRFDDVLLVGHASESRAALIDIQRASPDLVFLDLTMLTSREKRDVRSVLARGNPLIAFVVPRPQPVDAFEPGAIDYLPLPTTRRRTRATIDRAKARLRRSSKHASWKSTSLTGEASASPAADAFLQRVPARTHDGIRVIPVEELVSAVARREYLYLTTSDGEHHVILGPLKDLQARLNPASFLRLSRSTLVNVAFVRRIVPAQCGCTVALSNGDQHGASRRRTRELREKLLRL